MDVRPLIDEASAALRARDYETAARLVERSIEAGNDDLVLVARSLRIRILAELKRYEEASAEAAQVMKATSSLVEPRDVALLTANLGLATRQLGDRQAAREYCRLALDADPANEDALQLEAELDPTRKWWQVWR
jgi:tetratricopeptide (TPR) repeat protein